MRLIFLFSLFFLGCVEASVPKVIVSIAPTKCLVETIGGDKLECTLFVPQGTSPHSYEPSMKQIIDASNASLWFRIGEGFETRVLRVFKDKMGIIDLRDGLALIPSSCSCHGSNELDTHIWLNPSMLKIQAQRIGQALSEAFPEHKEEFQNRLNLLLGELTILDRELQDICAASCRHYFISAHPAFGYFCKEYGFEEMPIEIAGKEPTARQITTLIDQAIQRNVNCVIIEPQYSKKGALHIARELGADVRLLDPYEEKVIENLKSIAHTLSQ